MYDQDKYIGLDQDVWNTYSRRLQDVLIKTNVCWVSCNKYFHILITILEEIWVYETLLVQLFFVTVKDKNVKNKTQI